MNCLNIKVKFQLVIKNTFTGDILLVSEVDYEQNKDFVLTIRAQDLTDDPLMSDTTLHIHVLDVNDNKPVFNNLNFPVSINYFEK